MEVDLREKSAETTVTPKKYFWNELKRFQETSASATTTTTTTASATTETAASATTTTTKTTATATTTTATTTTTTRRDVMRCDIAQPLLQRDLLCKEIRS